MTKDQQVRKGLGDESAPVLWIAAIAAAVAVCFYPPVQELAGMALYFLGQGFSAIQG